MIFLLGVSVVLPTFAPPPYLQSRTDDVGQDFGDCSHHTDFSADSIRDVISAEASGHINREGMTKSRPSARRMLPVPVRWPLLHAFDDIPIS